MTDKEKQPKKWSNALNKPWFYLDVTGAWDIDGKFADEERLVAALNDSTETAIRNAEIVKDIEKRLAESEAKRSIFRDDLIEICKHHPHCKGDTLTLDKQDARVIECWAIMEDGKIIYAHWKEHIVDTDIPLGGEKEHGYFVTLG